jgi:hypothetical protein
VTDTVDPDARSPQLGLKYKDLALLGQLMERGADLTQPRVVTHYSYAPSEPAARALADAAANAGFASDVHPAPTGTSNEWSVVSRRNAVLSPDFVRDSTDLFEELAHQFDAEYDGWETTL